MSILNNNENLPTNINLNEHVVYKGGSGRILKKSLSSFNTHYSKSFDQTVEGSRDTNNNKGFKRATSTNCLNTLQNNQLKLIAPREV